MNYLNEKLRKQSPFTIALKSIKHLEISLTQEVKDLYNKNYKTLTKKRLKKTQMELYPMFLDWNNLYCKNVHTTQS